MRNNCVKICYNDPDCSHYQQEKQHVPNKTAVHLKRGVEPPPDTSCTSSLSQAIDSIQQSVPITFVGRPSCEVL